jgi:hypothetical protein
MKLETLGREPRVSRHGTNSKYSMGCRCEDCTEAHRLYRREQNYRAGVCFPRVDASRVKPLVECLIGFGITRKKITEASGVSYKTLGMGRPLVLKKTADAIYRLHWGAWRASGVFRGHCCCEVPYEVLDSLERAS